MLNLRSLLKRAINLLGFVLFLSCSTWDAMAANAVPESSYMPLRLNGKVDVDLDVIAWPDGKYSLPVKYLADLLDLLPRQVGSDHSITWSNPLNGQTVRIDQNQKRVTIGSQVLENLPHGVVYLEKGLFSQQDLYIDQDMLEKLLDVSISTDINSQQVALDVQRPLKILLRASQSDAAPSQSPSGKNVPESIIQPEGQQQLLETITLDFSSANTQQLSRQNGLGSNQAATFVNTGASLSTGFHGRLGQFPFVLTPKLSYLNGNIGFSDVQGQVKWKGDQKQSTAGTVNPSLGALVAPSVSVLGVQYATDNASGLQVGEQGLHEFQGDAPDKGPVTLKLNNNAYDSQFPQKNKYHFTNVMLTPNRVNKISIVQKDKNGAEKVLYQARVPFYPKTLNKGERAFSAFAGRSQYQWTPPGLNLQEQKGLFLQQSNKWLAGARYAYGVTDRLTVGASAAGDTILGQAKTSELNDLLNRLQSPDLTGYVGLRRDPNLISGVSGGVNAAYRVSDWLTLTGDLAVSDHNAVSGTIIAAAPSAGWSGVLGADFHVGEIQAALKLYNYGTSYYTPMTLSENNLFDRRGGSLDVSGERFGWHYRANLNHFNSNLTGLLSDGTIHINRWDVSLYRRFNATTDLQVQLSGIRGHNDSQQLKMDNDQVTLSHLFWGNLEGQLGYRLASNQAYYDNLGSGGLINLLTPGQSIHYFRSSVRVPLGARLNHSNILMGFDYSQLLRFATLQAQFKMWRFSLEPSLQQSCPGPQSLFRIGLGLYYQTSSGRRIGLRYSYGHSTLPAISTFLGSSLRTNHQVQLDFNDALALIGHTLTSVGTVNNQYGQLKGLVFLDTNMNGKREADEPVVPDIPVQLDGNRVVKSNAKGEFAISQLSSGLHHAKFDVDNLALTLTPVTQNVAFQIAGRKQTRISMGILVTPGAFSGTVHLTDGNKKPMNPEGVMMVLKNAKTNQELQFTYTDAQGHYSIEQVPPGTYTVIINESQATQKTYRILKQPEAIEVPLDPNHFHDRQGLDFEVLQLMSDS